MRLRCEFTFIDVQLPAVGARDAHRDWLIELLQALQPFRLLFEKVAVVTGRRRSAVDSTRRAIPVTHVPSFRAAFSASTLSLSDGGTVS